MNKAELKTNLDLIKVDPKNYSLEGELNPDATVLFQNYAKWEVFYLDERGKRHKEQIFVSENDACQYIYDLFKKSKAIEKKYGLNTIDYKLSANWNAENHKYFGYGVGGALANKGYANIVGDADVWSGKLQIGAVLQTRDYYSTFEEARSDRFANHGHSIFFIDICSTTREI